MDNGLSLNPNKNPNSDGLNYTPADLSSAVTLLDDLVSAAEATLRSVHALLSPTPSSSSSSSALYLFSGRENALPCPYDSRHRMPPEQLFRHSLRCSSAPGVAIPQLNFLDAARYPGTLKSEAELGRQDTNRFSSPEPGATDLCLSLDGELGDVSAGGAGFFYRDCPGVVSFPEPDASRSIFTLPRILFVHCDDFKGRTDSENGYSGKGRVRILPSELWALRLEVMAWGDCPSSYSFVVLRAISCLDALEERSLRDWVISASCKHGILLDCAMRDHIFVLFKLCLKAVWSEAAGTLENLSANSGRPLGSVCYDCPCLLGSISWLSSILSILYGETSGRGFSIDMLKEALLQSGSNSLIFPNNLEEPDDSNRCAEGHNRGQEVMNSYGQRIGHSLVFVSQVAAAVTALQERSLMETRIRDLRFPQPHNKTQILIEHSQTSTRADEERFRRPNYRAIVEHDGIVGQPSSNKGQNKPKTKEELLAEERDYKRRRMSYRGKKNKRNPNQVLHDIIEEYMEEIRLAGGIMSPSKISGDAGLERLESSVQGAIIHSYTEERDSHCSIKRTYTDVDNSYKTSKDGLDSEMAYKSHPLREHEEKRCRYNQSPGKDSRRQSHGYEDEGETYYKSQSHVGSRLQRHHIHGKYEESESISYRGKNERRSSNYSKRSAEYRPSSHGKINSQERHFEDLWPEDHEHSSFEDRYDPSSSSDVYDSYHSYSFKRQCRKSNEQKDDTFRDSPHDRSTRK